MPDMPIADIETTGTRTRALQLVRDWIAEQLEHEDERVSPAYAARQLALLLGWDVPAAAVPGRGPGPYWRPDHILHLNRYGSPAAPDVRRCASSVPHGPHLVVETGLRCPGSETAPWIFAALDGTCVSCGGRFVSGQKIQAWGDGYRCEDCG